MSAMNYPLMILGGAGAIGAIDVLYFHLYRFRLFAHDGCVAEEITHLCRHAIFLGLLALLSAGTPSRIVDQVIIGLFALDMVNSVIDVTEGVIFARVLMRRRLARGSFVSATRFPINRVVCD